MSLAHLADKTYCSSFIPFITLQNKSPHNPVSQPDSRVQAAQVRHTHSETLLKMLKLGLGLLKMLKLGKNLQRHGFASMLAQFLQQQKQGSFQVNEGSKVVI